MTMRIVGVFAWLALSMAASAVWLAHAQQPAADDPRFTGKTSTMDAKGLGVSRRHFEPGARSAWHSHDNGQLIFVEEGRARTRKRGQPIRDLAQGESDYAGPNVVHWHGSAPGHSLLQVAVGFGGETKWMEKVTDEEYAGKGRR